MPTLYFPPFLLRVFLNGRRFATRHSLLSCPFPRRPSLPRSIIRRTSPPVCTLRSYTPPRHSRGPAGRPILLLLNFSHKSVKHSSFEWRNTLPPTSPFFLMIIAPLPFQLSFPPLFQKDNCPFHLVPKAPSPLKTQGYFWIKPPSGSQEFPFPPQRSRRPVLSLL